MTEINAASETNITWLRLAFCESLAARHVQLYTNTLIKTSLYSIRYTCIPISVRRLSAYVNIANANHNVRATDLRHSYSTQFGCFVVGDEIVDHDDIWRLVQHFHLCSEHRCTVTSLVETRQVIVARGIILQREIIMLLD